MDKYLEQRYALLGKTANKDKTAANGLRSLLSNPKLYFIVFLFIAWTAGDMVVSKIIPISYITPYVQVFAYSIASIGFCLLMGYSGLASLGTGGFIGIGTYAVYYIMHQLGMRFWVSILVALVVAAVIGIIVGFISLRIEGIYLVILTLGLSEILRYAYMALEDNIRISNKFTILNGIEINRPHKIFIVSTALVIVMIITHNIINSPTGRAMLAMKNSTAAAQAMGISLIKYRLMAFVICTMYAALSGVMIIIIKTSESASSGTSSYALITSLNILAAVIIGGYKSIWGAIFGTFVMFGMQSAILNRIPFFSENPEIIYIALGVIVILIVMFYPGGLAQLLLEVRTKAKKLYKTVREARYGKDLG